MWKTPSFVPAPAEATASILGREKQEVPASANSDNVM